jgi:predicted SnoaL-like aldol condensation-catalyzing enzyme
MRTGIRASVVLPALVMAAACGTPGSNAGFEPAAPAEIEAPAPAPVVDPAEAKQLLLDFFSFQGTRQERADQVMTADYVQHNPRVLRMDALTGASGSQAWVAAGERAGTMGLRLVALGGIRLRDPIILMAEGDLVTAIYRGTVARPDDPALGYEAYAFETFRVRDGRVSEHWDQVRLAPGWMEPGFEPAPAALPQPEPVTQPMPSGGCTATPADLEAAKALALAALDTGDDTDVAMRLSGLSEDFVSHSPVVARQAEVNVIASRDAFAEVMVEGLTGSGRGAMAPRVADLVTAECDYVTVVWQQATLDPDDAMRTYGAFTFDTFRVADGRLAEHWDSSTLP